MTKGGAIHAHPATLLALVLFTLVSLGLGVVANLATSRKAGFLRKYFLGNRSLGAFAVALTAGSPGRCDEAADNVCRYLDARFPQGVRVERRVASWNDLESLR